MLYKHTYITILLQSWKTYPTVGAQTSEYTKIPLSWLVWVLLNDVPYIVVCSS